MKSKNIERCSIIILFVSTYTAVFLASIENNIRDLAIVIVLFPLVFAMGYNFYKDTKIALAIRIKDALLPYKNIPIGTIFSKNGPKINPQYSFHQTLFVQEWIDRHPNTILDKEIWDSSRVQFKNAPHTIAITKKGIEIQDHQGNSLLTITKINGYKSLAEYKTSDR